MSEFLGGPIYLPLWCSIRGKHGFSSYSYSQTPGRVWFYNWFLICPLLFCQHIEMLSRNLDPAALLPMRLPQLPKPQGGSYRRGHKLTWMANWASVGLNGNGASSGSKRCGLEVLGIDISGIIKKIHFACLFQQESVCPRRLPWFAARICISLR